LISPQKVLTIFKRALEKAGPGSGMTLPSEAEVKAMIQAGDFDKDGFLNEEEFNGIYDAATAQ
jgi:Ca2+-binding EF-hand superfamily protein